MEITMKTLKGIIMLIPSRGERPAAGWIAPFLSVLVLAVFQAHLALAAEPPCPGIHVKVLKIRNSTGTIDCALFESPSGFPHEALRSAKSVVVLKISETQATCDFENVPPGTYALVVIHDENKNGKLDTNAFGKPTEGYGFSNSAKASLRAPSFSDASIEYPGGVLNLTVTMHY
jgi:uncharacterized protein (DUF2141 family)